ncbi:cadherin-related family member 2 isoform X2 [Odontesthes bonariensis]|uniref:cadherin-related family member 2 isoform X2 n=1 Tax=Odontesthes bonariensis TaxID=219752 RepID=UPI003F580C3F
MGGITGSILLCLLLLAKATSSPSITKKVYFVCEDTPKGSHAFDILASDPDGEALTFILTGSGATFFSVESSTGRVSVRAPLDRETGDLMNIGVTVSDGVNTIFDQLTVILNDTNDNPPLFQQTSYDYEIPENTTVGTSLYRVQATDADTGVASVIRYSISEITPANGIEVFDISTATGYVTLKKSLNYTSLSSFYRMRITATDGGGSCASDEVVFLSSNVFSFITVKDVPDLDPLFIGTPYVGRIEENSAVGTSVSQVTAIDQDTGINDAMIYSIEDSTVEGLFGISRDTGVISVLSNIDREVVGDTVTLTVKATESNTNVHGTHSSTTTTVQINILDVNDNTPEFYKCGSSCVSATEFTGEVLEHSLGSIPINMTVRDLDKLSHTELSLVGEDKDVFSVEPSFTMSDSIVQLLVREPHNLDFEKKQQMILQVIAVDKETNLGSTATVTINIMDANDNSPSFANDTYKLSVEEHSAAGTTLETITAEDPDTMDQGKLTYRLLPDSILQYFDVEQHTGRVYVKSQALLDREVRSLYSATLQARDTDNKPGTTVLEITLTDINDQSPIIGRDSYLEFVKEGGKLEVKIEATDTDEPNTPNSQIVYSIVLGNHSSMFSIDPDTGVLTNTGDLDREALDPELNGRIELTVTATDMGTPPLSSTVPVIINVEDINDNSPAFLASSYNFSVKEGERGAFVGSVHAEDLDQTTDFNRISFSIIDGSFGSFIIRTFSDVRGYRGNITVDPDIELDFESTRKEYQMRLEATDLEQKKAFMMVDVIVLDVNDERPEFMATVPISVKENTTKSDAVGTFTAIDRDGNHSLVYKLESVTCMCQDVATPCNWFIVDRNGDIRVNPEETVDYEQCKQAVVEAQVVDEYTEKGENSSVTPGQMVINIEDINDNNPEFIPTDTVFVVVSESASRGTSVARVIATDRDTGENSVIDFQVENILFQNTNNITNTMTRVFEAFTSQQTNSYVGIIQTTEGLDLNLQGKYLVRVRATDAGGLFSTTLLEIFTIDEFFRVELQFGISKIEVENKRNEIVRALTAATTAAVEIVAIRSVGSPETRAETKTIMVAYFVFANGTALTSSEVEKMLSHRDHYLTLIELGLSNIGNVPEIETATDPLKFILMGMIGGLIIVLSVLTTSLLCTRRKYRTKLKAANARNSASMGNSDNQKGGTVVPGTNKYTMEGANPVLNLDIHTSINLDMDADSSDVDKVSLNSLDLYETITDKGTKRSMSIQEEEEDNGPPDYKEPLGAALAQLDNKKSVDKPNVGFVNPIFDTTDL